MKLFEIVYIRSENKLAYWVFPLKNSRFLTYRNKKNYWNKLTSFKAND